MTSTLSAERLARTLRLRDLTDGILGDHAMQIILRDIVARVAQTYGAAVITHRTHPVVDITHNYDRLGYPPGGAARNARYTRYVSEAIILRTQTSAEIPSLLTRVAQHPLVEPLLLVCPGLVYRRDTIDRLHVGEPHQVDLWLLAPRALGDDDLEAMIDSALAAALPGRQHRTEPAVHPYTHAGRQIDVQDGERWVEVGECGLASPSVMKNAGLDIHHVGGLAMGLGLDRLLMLRKGIEDIRLLRSEDPRIAAQMRDLQPYRPVSKHPPIRRDLSLAVDASRDAETLGDRLREHLGQDAELVESIAVVSETPYDQLPEQAKVRMGLGPGQKNVLLSVILRHHHRSLSDEEANALRDRVYAALHEGSRSEWAIVAPRRA